MSTPEERLAELGLAIPEVAKPVAAYVPAVRSGNQVFTSGQLPMRAGELIATGKVGTEVTEEEAYACAQQCALNAIAAINAEVGDLSMVKRIVKVVVFVASAPDYTGQPNDRLVQGFSSIQPIAKRVYACQFPSGPCARRSGWQGRRCLFPPSYLGHLGRWRRKRSRPRPPSAASPACRS